MSSGATEPSLINAWASIESDIKNPALLNKISANPKNSFLDKIQVKIGTALSSFALVSSGIVIMAGLEPTQAMLTAFSLPISAVLLNIMVHNNLEDYPEQLKKAQAFKQFQSNVKQLQKIALRHHIEPSTIILPLLLKTPSSDQHPSKNMNRAMPGSTTLATLITLAGKPITHYKNIDAATIPDFDIHVAREKVLSLAQTPIPSLNTVNHKSTPSSEDHQVPIFPGPHF